MTDLSPIRPEVYRSGQQVMIRLAGDRPVGFSSLEAQLTATEAEEFINSIRDVVDEIHYPVVGLPVS